MHMINPIQKLLNTKFRNKLVFMCITAVVPVTLAGVFLLYNLADTIKVNAENESISTADSLRTIFWPLPDIWTAATYRYGSAT